MNEIEIIPRNTYAIVVGVDKYPKLPGGWELKNAVREAHEFAGWLLEKGLRADQIRLFVSGGVIPVPLIDSVGNVVSAEDPAGVRTAVLEPTFAGPSRENLLFIYWAGHGQTDDYQHQLLFDQNYSLQDRLVYDLDDVKRALRSESWESFPRQIILVNACANDPAGAFNQHSFKNLQLKGQEKRKQFTICAASPGEYAGDGGSAEPSEFFKLLLSSLREGAQGGKPFSMTDVCARLCAGESALKSTPRIEWIDWKRSRFGWSGDRLSRLIYRRISKCGIDQDRLAELYRGCIEQPRDVNSVAEIVGHLEYIVSSNQDKNRWTKYGLVLDYALHAIHRYADDAQLAGLNQELTKFFDDPANDYETPQLMRARKYISEIYRQPVPPLYLSIVPSDADDTFVLYLHDDTQRRLFQETIALDAKEDFELAFRRAICSLEEKLAEHIDQLHFHFFLNVEKLLLELHKWQDPFRKGDGKTLERYYPVALRFRERARGVDPTTGKPIKAATGRWLRKTEILKSRAATTYLRINWLDNENGECSFDDATQDHECVGLFCCPSIETLREVMEEGLPFLFWPRVDCVDWRACGPVFDALEIGGSLHTALEHFPRIRRAMRDAHFAVIWDDPERNPNALLLGDETRVKPAFVDMM